MTSRFALTLFLVVFLPMPAMTAMRGRTVRGKVYDSAGAAVKGAVVQLKNTTTLSIRSYLTEQDGGYRFVGLSLDHEYELRASFDGHWSSTERVSVFDSREVVEVDLKIRRHSEHDGAMQMGSACSLKWRNKCCAASTL